MLLRAPRRGISSSLPTKRPIAGAPTTGSDLATNRSSMAAQPAGNVAIGLASLDANPDLLTFLERHSTRALLAVT